jgi:glycosyltransferase involved in cell wall biosynthesis
MPHSSDPSKLLWKRLLGPPYRFLRSKLWRLHPRAVAAQVGWLVSVARQVRRRRRDPRLTVAVDVRILWEPLTGIGWYLYRLLQRLAERDDLALRLYGPSLSADEAVPPPVVPIPEGPAVEVVRYAAPEEATLHRDRMIRLIRRLERLLVAADGNRVLFAPNYLPSERFERATGALVATVHDLGYRIVPWAIRQETLANLEAELDATWWRARRIITDSRAVADEMAVEELVAPTDAGVKVRVIPLGPGLPLGGPDAGLPEGVPAGYALSVGTLEPRKNLETLLRAWRHLRRRRRGRGEATPPLVLCGGYGWKAEGLRREVEAARAEGWLHHFGYVSEEELAAFYRHARLFVFPSRYEGFGLPLLEAMSAGVPAVASDLPVLRELAGDAALYAPPRNEEAWAERVDGLLDDPDLAARLAAAGRERAARFTWERAAEEHMAVFREAADP